MTKKDPPEDTGDERAGRKTPSDDPPVEPRETQRSIGEVFAGLPANEKDRIRRLIDRLLGRHGR